MNFREKIKPIMYSYPKGLGNVSHTCISSKDKQLWYALRIIVPDNFVMSSEILRVVCPSGKNVGSPTTIWGSSEYDLYRHSNAGAEYLYYMCEMTNGMSPEYAGNRLGVLKYES